MKKEDIKEAIKQIKSKDEYKLEIIKILNELPIIITKCKGNITMEVANTLNKKVERLNEIHILLEVLNHDEI